MTRQEFIAKMSYNLTQHSLAKPDTYGIKTYEEFIEKVIDIVDDDDPGELVDILTKDAGSFADLQNHAEDFRKNVGVVGYILDNLAEFNSDTIHRIVAGR